jgi:hypothetical protein
MYEFPVAISYRELTRPEPNEFCHLYTRGTDTHHRKHMSLDYHPPPRDVAANTGNTVSSTVACWTVFTELLPGNALIKPLTIRIYFVLIYFYMKDLTNFTQKNCNSLMKQHIVT